MKKLTIVMYHYVRDLPNSRFPEIKGLRTDLFLGQLDYLARHYTFVTMEQVLEALHHGDAPSSDPGLPDNGVLLTFDDGYSEHFNTVFPILANRGIQGCFFPPANAILEQQVLDVNKIHFLLASAPHPKELVEDVLDQLDRHRASFDLQPNEHYYSKLAVASRYDPAEVMFVKRLLQKELPVDLRQRIADDLFEKYVGVPQHVFARELYLSLEQIRCMKQNGMFFGSHGCRHVWLNTLSQEELEQDIDGSLEFLEHAGVARHDWAMCYPYGAHSPQVLEALRQRHCAVGLTTNISLAQLTPDNALTLGRLDTNDLPKQADAQPNSWTQQVHGR